MTPNPFAAKCDDCRKQPASYRCYGGTRRWKVCKGCATKHAGFGHRVLTIKGDKR